MTDKRWAPAPGATLRCNPASMRGAQGNAKRMRCLMILGKAGDGRWLALPTTTSWAGLGWQKPIDNSGEWGLKGGWDFRSRDAQYWAPNQYMLLTDEEAWDLAETYGRLNYAPEHIWRHGMQEYKYAKQHGLLDDRAFFAQATRLKKKR